MLGQTAMNASPALLGDQEATNKPWVPNIRAHPYAGLHLLTDTLTVSHFGSHFLGTRNGP